MTSLKKYLEQEKEDVASWLARIVILLLEATALHAVDYDPEEHAEFRRQTRETIENFEETNGSRNALIIAGGAVKSLQLYNKGVERFIRNLSAEKQAIIGTVTESFLKLAHASERAGQNLRSIERELATACQLQDVRALKSKMYDCLETICQEAARQEERARELKVPGTNLANSSAPYDQITGLPSLQHAEARIKEIIEAEGAGYVVVLFVKNLDSINRRVGYAAGDQILTLLSQKVAQNMLAGDQLFRWRGPCFVAVLERAEKPDKVLAEAAKLGSIVLEKEIEAQGRSLFLKAQMAWTLMQLQNVPQAGEVSVRIDAFTAQQTQPKGTGH
jgi:GGDEF domain-containing protein